MSETEGMETQGAWYESLEVDDAVKKSISKYKSVEDFATGHANLAKMVGNSIRIPGDDATDEQRSEFDKKLAGILGVPETVDGYEITAPENLPEGIVWNEEVAGQFKQFCHENKISATQAKALIDFHTKSTVGQFENMAAQRQQQADKATEALVKELGGQEKFDAYLKQAAKAVEYVESKVPGFKEFLNTSGAGNAPEFVKMMNTVYQDKIAEDSFVAGQGVTTESAGILSDDFYKNPK